MAIVLDGKKVAGQIKADLASRVAGLARMGMVPGLGTVLVGDDPGSMKYVEGKHRDCEECDASQDGGDGVESVAECTHDVP